MVSELRCKKETKDHILVGTMARVLWKGFKFLGNLATIENIVDSQDHVIS